MSDGSLQVPFSCARRYIVLTLDQSYAFFCLLVVYGCFGKKKNYIPNNAFPNETFFYQQEIGMRNINPLQITSKATMIRTAKISCTLKPEWLNLQKTRNEKGPMLNLAIPENSRGKDNPWWSDPAFADNFFEAKKQSQTAHGALLKTTHTKKKALPKPV